jgi:hypothetical protein
MNIQISEQYLNENDKLLIKKSLISIVNGPYIDDNEFDLLIEASRDEVRTLAMLWPDIESNNLHSWLVIYSCLSNLLGYPHGEDERLYKELNCDETQLDQVFDKVKLIINQFPSQNNLADK